MVGLTKRQKAGKKNNSKKDDSSTNIIVGGFTSFDFLNILNSGDRIWTNKINYSKVTVELLFIGFLKILCCTGFTNKRLHVAQRSSLDS